MRLMYERRYIVPVRWASNGKFSLNTVKHSNIFRLNLVDGSSSSHLQLDYVSVIISDYIVEALPLRRLSSPNYNYETAAKVESDSLKNRQRQSGFSLICIFSKALTCWRICGKIIDLLFSHTPSMEYVWHEVLLSITFLASLPWKRKETSTFFFFFFEGLRCICLVRWVTLSRTWRLNRWHLCGLMCQVSGQLWYLSWQMFRWPEGETCCLVSQPHTNPILASPLIWLNSNPDIRLIPTLILTLKLNFKTLKRGWRTIKRFPQRSKGSCQITSPSSCF